MPGVGGSVDDVVVIGAGVVGASCAWHIARAGLGVTVLDRGPVAGGTTGAGEGNVLVSDKKPGPELELAVLSLELWHKAAKDLAGFEYEAKGGLVVAETDSAFTDLVGQAELQSRAGVRAEVAPGSRLGEYEPHLTAGLAGGVFYPDDAQVQPMLATARMLAAARAMGATVRTGLNVLDIVQDGRRVVGVRTAAGMVRGAAVINAAGPWSADIAAMAGVRVPVEPRRGFILVTEPLPRVVRHKVYAADYAATVGSDDDSLQVSAVVEGTASGPVLIGSSRERVGFDRTISVSVLRALAAHAVRLFPILAGIAAIRSYRGYRPYSPDHLPVIGPDPRAPGLWHACGHEGAGIGLAMATGHLIAQFLSGGTPDIDLGPFRPERFA